MMNKLGMIAMLAVSFFYAENGWANRMIAAQGTVTADCSKDVPSYTYEGEIDSPTPITTNELQRQCNARYKDCNNLCDASINTSKTFKKRALKAKPHR